MKVCLLTPDMASQNYGRHDIDLSAVRPSDVMDGIFLTPYLASKSSLILYPQSIAQLQHLTLHITLQLVTHFRQRWH